MLSAKGLWRGLALALTATAALAAACKGEESPGDKQEWSILQAIEWSTRTETALKARFEKRSDYELLGVPRIGDSRVIWILLKPTHGSLYKQMPEGNYWIEPALWSELHAHDRVSPTVDEALRGHLRRIGESELPVSEGAGQQ